MNVPAILRSAGIAPEIAPRAIAADDRVRVPQANNAWFRPLLLCAAIGWRHKACRAVHPVRGPAVKLATAANGLYTALTGDGIPPLIAARLMMPTRSTRFAVAR